MARKLDQEKFDTKRQKILDAAMVCVSRNGFHQTSVAQICAEAGTSTGSLFHYFESKEEIIAAIAAEERRATAALFERIGNGDDLFAGLLDFIDDCLLLAKNPVYVRLEMEIATEAMRNPRIAEIFSEKDAVLKAGLSDHIRKAAMKGQLDATLDPDDVAIWLLALADGAISRAALDPAFNSDGQGSMLRCLVTRFLRPCQ